MPIYNPRAIDYTKGTINNLDGTNKLIKIGCYVMTSEEAINCRKDNIINGGNKNVI